MKITGLTVCSLLGILAAAIGPPASQGKQSSPAHRPQDQYLDRSDGRDWPGYGRTFSQQHYSPLAKINEGNVDRLNLAWSLDLEPLKNTATQPIAVGGVLYFATGLSVVHAVDAASGKLLWRYDPKAAEKAGLNLRHGWGVRGISWWDGNIYLGTVDGRLIAIDARTGLPVWSAQTIDKDCPAHINGAPRVFAGKVIVGFASEFGRTRGYVTTYDAKTGRKLWRFYTVPDNPAAGFESKAMEMATKTWAGEWWKFGGGGNVWNAIAYDSETDTVFVGVGNGYPMNRRVRSADYGDNLFLGSIVALDGTTGSYRWHYQTTPGDTWDYDATMDIELADLVIADEPRKVLMQAPKNGFFYVIDRVTGELISAEPFVKVTWASRVDLATGRPVEVAGARYPNGTTAEVWPSGIGAHSWMPMAYNPHTGLVYIPTIELGNKLSDRSVDFKNWQPRRDRSYDFGAEASYFGPQDGITAALIAWNPVTQNAIWSARYTTIVNSGVLTTGGGLVFQGSIDGMLKAYAADSGKLLWSYAVQAPLMGSPISYNVNGDQYVTVLSGLGMSGIFGATLEQAEQYRLDARTQARRVLTFKLDGNAQLLSSENKPLPFIADPNFQPDALSANAGQVLYNRHCVTCHGAPAAVRHAPDLRRSGVVLSATAFESVVRGGSLVTEGMPEFGEFSDQQLSHLRHYLRTEAHNLRQENAEP